MVRANIFLCIFGKFLCKIPNLFFGGSSYIYTALDKLPKSNSTLCEMHDRLINIIYLCIKQINQNIFICAKTVYWWHWEAILKFIIHLEILNIILLLITFSSIYLYFLNNNIPCISGIFKTHERLENISIMKVDMQKDKIFPHAYLGWFLNKLSDPPTKLRFLFIIH